MDDRKSTNRIPVITSTFGRICKAGLLIIALFGMYFCQIRVNAENAYTPVDAVIRFECESVKEADMEYRIRIRTENENIPLPDRDTIRINNEGQGSFHLQLTEPGTYDYLVYQEIGTDDSIRYDETKYDIHVFVTENEAGILDYSVAVNLAGTDKKPEKVTFRNELKNATRPTETTEEDTEETTEKPPTNVQTGDDTSLTLLITLCTVSASGILAILGLLMMKRRKKGEEDSESDPQKGSDADDDQGSEN